MTSKAIMIEEATKARNGLAAELRGAMGTQAKGGKIDAAWLADRIESLGYYNRLLTSLGAIPAL